ncbi:MAG: hypothetical protein N2444_05470, partial [Methylocystis sp.]|nr:hypothetical protein [Methylocystis sp.]
ARRQRQMRIRERYTPQDALELASRTIALSEELINTITLRRRNDALAHWESEVSLARSKLTEARAKTLAFRNQNDIIDPGSRASSLNDTINKLTLERAGIVSDLATVAPQLSASAPSQKLQRTRLAAIDQQLVELRKKLADSNDKSTVSQQIAQYERLKLDEQFAEKLYTISMDAYNKARQDLEKQQLYLVTVVKPSLPEAATFPRVAANTTLCFFVLFVGWAVVALIVASIDDHFA